MNRKTEEFLNKYRELESIAAAEYDLDESDSAVAFLMRRPEFQSIKRELDYCKDVRNLLSHNPKINDSYAVEPSEEMLHTLDSVIRRVREPKRAKHIMVPRKKVLCRDMDDPVKPAMVRMNEQLFTHVPIMKDGVVVGVFSENTLLRYLIDDPLARIDDQMRFLDIEKYLPLEQHRAESFRFVAQNALASDIEELFAQATRKHDRIGLVFVTANGKPTERLLGIISAWDVAGVD